MVHAYCVQFRGVSFIIQNITHELDNRSFLTFSEMPNRFLMHIADGFGNEQIRIQGSPPRMYHSLHEYLDIMSLPTAYAGYIEIAAAQQIYNIKIEVVVAGNITSSSTAAATKHTTCPLQSTLFALFYLTNWAQPCSFSVTIRGFSCITPRVCGLRYSEGGSCIYIICQS